MNGARTRRGDAAPCTPCGAGLRWAKRRWFFHELEVYFHRCGKDICCLCSLLAEAKGRNARRFDPTVWPARSISPPGPDNPSAVMIELKSEGRQVGWAWRRRRVKNGIPSVLFTFKKIDEFPVKMIARIFICGKYELS